MAEKKKFDVAIMNPPYSGNLHLKILEKIIPVADEVINISPIRWLQDPLAKYKKNSDFNKRQDSIVKHIKDLKSITTTEACDLFDAGFNMQLGIYKIDNDEHQFNSTDNTLLDKIISKLPEDKVKLKYKEPEKYSVVITLISGGKNGSTEKHSRWMLPKEKAFYINGRNSNGETYKEYRDKIIWGNLKSKSEVTLIEFNTKDEMENFYDACETTFVRYVFKQELVDVNVHYDFLPIMQDYSQPWTNERFCDYFGITGFISDTEAEPGSEWEEILNIMEKYK